MILAIHINISLHAYLDFFPIFMDSNAVKLSLKSLRPNKWRSKRKTYSTELRGAARARVSFEAGRGNVPSLITQAMRRDKRCRCN